MTRTGAAALLVLAGAGYFGAQIATSAAASAPAGETGTPSRGIKKVIPRGLLLSRPATQPKCSKLPTSYELGLSFQLDRRRCLLVTNLDEQGGPDLCIGNDAFVFEKLSDIKAEKAIEINRAEPDYMGPGKTKPSFLAKYPVSGFFVPLGSLLPNGQPHPAAGTGLLLSVAVAFAADRSDPNTPGSNASAWKSWETLVEFIQIRWDGKKLSITDKKKVRELFGHKLLSAPFSHMARMDKGFVGPFEYPDIGLRLIRFDWDGKAWTATRNGDSFSVTDHEFESTIQQQGNRYLLSTRDDKDPKVRIYSSSDGMKFQFLFESKNHTVPRALNQGLDGTIYLATNTGPGYLRNPLLAFPMVGKSFGEPIIIHDQDGVRNDQGDKIPFVDHGQASNLFLEGRWQHLVFYRVCDLKERTLYGFQTALKQRIHGPQGPIPKRASSGIYATELQFEGTTIPPVQFAK